MLQKSLPPELPHIFGHYFFTKQLLPVKMVNQEDSYLSYHLLSVISIMLYKPDVSVLA